MEVSGRRFDLYGVLERSEKTKKMALKLLAKVLVGGGAVYITLDQGVWSTSSKGSNAVERIRTNVLPATNDYLNKVPSAKCINKAAKSSWNSGVEKTFSLLANSPEQLCEYSHKAHKLIKDKIGLTEN